MPENILIIDDHEPTLLLISKLLETVGYATFTAQSGDEGLTLFRQTAPDLVILDIMMPGIDGWEVCKRLRETSCVPIIFLTGLGSEKDLVAGLLSGADDYLTPHEQPQVLRFGNGDLIINRKEQTLFVHGQETRLSPIEYNLLLLLAGQAGRIVSTQSLTAAIWGSKDSKSLKWYIWRLRQKIEADPQNPRFILTERGKGYRFSPH